MKTKKRWTENCKYFSKQFYFNQYQGCYSFDNDLTFSEKKWQCLFFFSLSIPVISIQAGAGFLGQRKKSWGCVRGEKEAFVASASSSLCVFPLHGLFKKKNACYAGYIKNCLGIYFCRTNDAKSAWSLWVWTFDWLECVFKWCWFLRSGGSENNCVKNILSTLCGRHLASQWWYLHCI